MIDPALGNEQMKTWQTGDPQPFHGFVFWFDCVFADVDPSPDRYMPPREPAEHDPSRTIVLTTRPGNRTHWEQDVVLFSEMPDCAPGTPIRGVLRMRRNEHKKRHYDLEFSFRVGADHEMYKYAVI